MPDILTGFGVVVVVCILLLVLALQMQVRSLSHKLDSILKKLESR